MKFLIKKIYIILFLLIVFSIQTKSFGKTSKDNYKKENISNYFLGALSSENNYDEKAFEYLKKVKRLKNTHSEFNLRYLNTLVLLDKFDEAFSFAEDIWTEETLFYEADLLLSLKYFLKGNHKKGKIYFDRVNKVSRNNLFFKDFIGNAFMAWSAATTNNKINSFANLNKIPDRYDNIRDTQNIFLQCYFDSNQVEKSFDELDKNGKLDFSRYNFFHINYLLFKNKNIEAEKIIAKSREKYSSNLLLSQTENFFIDNKKNEIKKMFNCKNPKDALAEFFYVIANLYAGEQEYKMSNFYLKISLFLNNNFLPNKALLAENFYYQGKNEKSKNIYHSIKSIGPIYFWHATKNIASILLKENTNTKFSIDSIEKDFKLLINPNFQHYYELANFYKDNSYFEKSIKYYSIALNQIENDHYLVPKILDRRGTSYERIDKWKSAEKDLLKSLEILPDQPRVLNYLAYTWIDKGINLDKGLEMLIKANDLRKNDGYIIDSLGWAYFAKKNYVEAKFYLEQAVEILPLDPVINDHYADALWMLNKNIQARYFWDHILKFDATEEELKQKINKKLIFGVKN